VAPVAEGKGKTIGVAGCHDGDLQIPRGTKGGSVADGFPAAHPADQKDPGSPGEHRAEGRATAGAGIDAVQSEPRADVGHGIRMAR